MGMGKKKKRSGTKSKKQVGFLLSKGSPLKKSQKDRLKDELKSGKVRIRRGGSRRG